MQNLQFGLRKSTRNINIGAKAYAEGKTVFDEKIRVIND